MLDDSLLYQTISFTPTPLPDALKKTVEWYATSTDTKGLCIL